MRNDLDYNGSDGKDPFFLIFFPPYFCVDIFVRICFKLLLHFADQVQLFFFSLQFFKKLLFLPFVIGSMQCRVTEIRF